MAVPTDYLPLIPRGQVGMTRSARVRSMPAPLDLHQQPHTIGHERQSERGAEVAAQQLALEVAAADFGALVAAAGSAAGSRHAA